MKILLDENLPRKLVMALRAAGYREFTVAIAPGQERSLDDWARVKRALE